jgi:hypothetical protein
MGNKLFPLYRYARGLITSETYLDQVILNQIHNDLLNDHFSHNLVCHYYG